MNRSTAVLGRSAPLLDVDGLSVRFGGIVALDGVSFEVLDSQICGLIGPNGAGKTTLFNCLSRLYPIDHGDIRFEGRSLRSLAPHRIAARGIARTFQNLALFGSLSVRDNILTGGHASGQSGFLAHAMRQARVGREEAQLQQEVDALIDFLELGAVASRPVAELPLGTRKRVELARALAARPRLLLLDEPAAGLNHEEVGHLGELIRAVREQRGVSVLLVEHHMGLVMSIADKIVALDFGRKIAEGTPAMVRQQPDLISAYLGALP